MMPLWLSPGAAMLPFVSGLLVCPVPLSSRLDELSDSLSDVGRPTDCRSLSHIPRDAHMTLYQVFLLCITLPILQILQGRVGRGRIRPTVRHLSATTQGAPRAATQRDGHLAALVCAGLLWLTFQLSPLASIHCRRTASAMASSTVQCWRSRLAMARAMSRWVTASPRRTTAR